MGRVRTGGCRDGGVCEAEEGVVQAEGEVDGAREEESMWGDRSAYAISLGGVVGSGVWGYAAEIGCVGA